MLEFEFLNEHYAKAYWTDENEPITIVLDLLMRRKNENIKKVVKTIIMWYLQELICMNAPEETRDCSLNWCPMEFAMKRMLW